MDSDLLTLLTPLNIFVVVTAIVISCLIVFFIMQRKLHDLTLKNSLLTAELEHSEQLRQKEASSIEKARQDLSESFTQLSNQALQHNSTEFLKLAQENLKQFQIQAGNELDKKEKSIETLLKPVKEALDKTESQIRTIEKERKEAYGSLSKHLETMQLQQQQLQSETRNLVQALRRPEVRGQWGEMTLKRLAELAGMVEHCDFFEQEQSQTESGSIRPDMIVRMPDRREIIVDAKTPLDAYLSALEATDDAERDNHLQRHVRKVKDRIRELASKNYWNQFDNTPDFIVLFIPGDQFLSSALEREPAILEEALKQKVILATPTSLVALLRAVAYGWRQEQLAKNADVIRKLGEDMYSRLATFTSYMSKLGKNLNNSITQYNSAVSSFDSRILPAARKFVEMGVESKKEVEDISQIEKIAKQPQPTNDKDQEGNA